MDQSLLTAPDGSEVFAAPSRAAVLRPYAAVFAILAVLGFILVTFSSRDPSRRVTREEFGPAWPLTIGSATLTCEFRDEITVTSRGTTYTLTPPATRGAYEDIARIWADGTGDAGKKDLAPLIDEGLKLCR